MKKIILFVGTFWMGFAPCYGFDVGLAWDYNPEPDIVGYRIYCGGNNASLRVQVGNTNRYTWGGLELGNQYVFQVTAVNAAGQESEPSNQVILPVFPTIAFQPAIREQSALIFSQVEVNKVFVVEYADNVSGPWLPLGSSVGTPGLATVQDSERGLDNRFYRARLEDK